MAAMNTSTPSAIPALVAVERPSSEGVLALLPTPSTACPEVDEAADVDVDPDMGVDKDSDGDEVDVSGLDMDVGEFPAATNVEFSGVLIVLEASLPIRKEVLLK